MMMQDPVCRMTIDTARAARVLLAMAVAGFLSSAAAQNTEKPAGAAGHENTAQVRSHHEMQPLMLALSQAIDRMAAEMEQAGSPEGRKAMAARMQELSRMLGRMSGLLARPAHGPEERAQVAEMRRRLAALTKPDPAVSSAARVDERMAQLEAQLDQIDAQMHRIRATTDPAARSRLLGEHARALRASITTARELDRAFSPQMRAMMGGGTEIVSAERMMLAHQLMARRLSLMERQMEQVMEQSMGHGEVGPPR
jgi:hypothetical protein